VCGRFFSFFFSPPPTGQPPRHPKNIWNAPPPFPPPRLVTPGYPSQTGRVGPHSQLPPPVFFPLPRPGGAPNQKPPFCQPSKTRKINFETSCSVGFFPRPSPPQTPLQRKQDPPGPPPAPAGGPGGAGTLFRARKTAEPLPAALARLKWGPGGPAQTKRGCF